MKKRILSLALALILCFSLAAGAMAQWRFTDVNPGDWFYEHVKRAVETGLVDGKTDTTYNPYDNLTYAEAVKLAACMHKKASTGSDAFTQGSPWYQVYVDYAKAKGIITKDYVWNGKATRAGYMEIFARALPATVGAGGVPPLTAINSVPDGSIPDVPVTHPQAAAIYKLYRAGILDGVDSAFNCNPGANIRRSEVAAILTRMMNADARLHFSIGGETALTVTTHPEDQTAVEGEQVTFTVAASGGKTPYTYQWEYTYDGISGWEAADDSNYYSDARTAALTVRVVSADWNGNYRYRCVIADAAGSRVTSDDAGITEKTAALSITTHPEDQTAVEGEQVTFTVAASGGKTPYTYQWEYTYDGISGWEAADDSNYYSDARTAALTVRVVSADWNGNYRYRCVITDAAGSRVTSNSAGISKKNTLVITKQPENKLVPVNTWAAFTVEVAGGQKPYTYRWQLTTDSLSSWVNVPVYEDNYRGIDTATLRVRATVGDWTANYRYRCVITDAAGNQVMSAAVRIMEKMTFQSPQSVRGAVGDWVTFTMQVQGGVKPYTYQWQVLTNGANLQDISDTEYFQGAKTATLRTQVTRADFDYNLKYRCVVTDQNGQKACSDFAYVIGNR